MKRLIAAAALMLLTTAAHAGQASKMIPFYKGKFWLTYGMSSNNDGVPMCGMQTTGSDRLFYIKWIPTNGMIVQAWKQNWRLPEGSEVPFKLDFVDNANADNNRTITAEAALGTPSDAGRGSSVFMTIEDGEMGELLRVFAEADKMTLRFPAGDEPAWDAKMEGSRKAAEAFRGCIMGIQDYIAEVSTNLADYANLAGQVDVADQAWCDLMTAEEIKARIRWLNEMLKHPQFATLVKETKH